MSHRSGKLGILIPLLLLLLCNTAIGADRLEIYQLNQRSAAEIIPVIQPMLPTGSAINGHGYQLLVRGDEQTHSLVQQMLARIDSAPRNLLIEVRFSNPSTQVQRNTGAEISAQSGDVSVKAGDAPEQGTEIGISSNNAQLQLSDKITTTNSNNNSKYNLRVLEGNTAFIQTGTALPYNTTTLYPSGVAQSSIQYRQTRSGFLVRPRLNNDRVLLDILPSQEGLSSQGRGSIDTTKVQTTVSGRIGEWIELGNISSSTSTGNSGTLSSSTQQRNQSTHIYLKIELADN